MRFASILFLCGLGFAQQSGPFPPKPGPQKMPDPMVDGNAGFEPIFNGKSLKDWDGDPMYWRVENGSIVGETTPQTIPKFNSFIIWRGGTTKDFELKAEYRITAHGNSGINYRSVELPGVKWVMEGYQADIDGPEFAKMRYTGQNYEERGRTFLALRGQYTHIEEGKTPRVMLHWEIPRNSHSSSRMTTGMSIASSFAGT